MDNYLDLETGEVVSAALAALQLDLDRLTSERDMLRQVVRLSEEQQASQIRELADLRHEVRALRARLAAVDVPPGGMNITGRLVRLLNSAIAVVVGGRAIKIALAPGWEVPGETGDAVQVEARLTPLGWTAWRAYPAIARETGDLPPLDQALVERLTAPRPKTDPAAKLAAVEDLDKDAASPADLRRNSHHVSHISLHVVFCRWLRGKGMPLSDEMASVLKAEVKSVVEETIGWRLLAANTGSLDAAHKHDHLHLALGRVDASKSISAELGRLKAITSKRLRARFPEIAGWEHLWGAGMYIGAFGGPNREAVEAYIASQEQ